MDNKNMEGFEEYQIEKLGDVLSHRDTWEAACEWQRNKDANICHELKLDYRDNSGEINTKKQQIACQNCEEFILNQEV